MIEYLAEAYGHFAAALNGLWIWKTMLLMAVGVAGGLIAGAIASSRGMLEFHIDPESAAHKPAFNQDKTYVFYCASGGRSALAAVVAIDMGLAPVVNLTGGVGAWEKAGGSLMQS
mgnify:CR=1 FL=1